MVGWRELHGCGKAPETSLPVEVEVSPHSRVDWRQVCFQRLQEVVCTPHQWGHVKSKDQSSPHQTAERWWQAQLHKKHDSDFVDDIDFLIRVACSMYREVKQDSTKYARCVRKASMEEKENIDSALSCLSLGCHADEACAEDEENVTEKPASSKPALANPDSVFKKFCRKPPVHLSHLKQKALSLSQGLVAAMKLVAAGLL